MNVIETLSPLVVRIDYNLVASPLIEFLFAGGLPIYSKVQDYDYGQVEIEFRSVATGMPQSQHVRTVV
jgi:hypothetical protein